MLPVLLKTGCRQDGISGDHLRPGVRLNPIAPPVGKKSVCATGGRPAVDEIERIEVPFAQGHTHRHAQKFFCFHGGNTVL